MMSIFKRDRIQQIEQVLVFNKNFKTSDFSITETTVRDYNTLGSITTSPGEIKEGAQVTIKFIFSAGYFFRIEHYPHDKFIVSRSPGEVLVIENFSLETFGEVLGALRTWCRELWEALDISASDGEVQEDEFEELKKIWEQIDKAEALQSSEKFSESEKSNWEKKLSELEKRLRDQIEQSENNSAQRIRQLEQDIEFLRRSLNKFDKKNWFKAVASRLYESKSKESNETSPLHVLTSFINNESDEIKLIEQPKEKPGTGEI